MAAICAEVVFYDLKNKDTPQNTQSKPGNVDERINLVAAKVSDGDFEVIFKHRFRFKINSKINTKSENYAAL